MSLFKKTYRPRLSDDFKFLSDMTQEEQEEWLFATQRQASEMKLIVVENKGLRNKIQELNDQLQALENAFNDESRKLENARRGVQGHSDEAEYLLKKALDEIKRLYDVRERQSLRLNMFDDVMLLFRGAKNHHLTATPDVAFQIEQFLHGTKKA